MEKPAIKAAKLAMEADGNIIGVSFIVNTEKNLSDKLGTMFGIVEIYNANSGFADAFLEAIDDLKTEYYLPPFNLARGVEKRFEEALARANRRLQTAVTQSIEEVDLRNISAVIGILIGNQIYVTSVGHIKGFFFRRKKNLELAIVDILSGDGEKHYRPEPEKIFANILNGELADRDAVLFANEEFLAFFSQMELGEISLANPAAETVQFLDAAIKEKVAKKNFYAIALRSDNLVEESPAGIANVEKISTEHKKTFPLPKEETAAKPPRPIHPQSQDSLNQLLITQVRTEKYLSPSLMPNWQKVLVLGAGQLKRAGKFIGKKSAQAATAAASAAKAKTAEIKAKKAAAKAEAIDNFRPQINAGRSEESVVLPPAAFNEEQEEEIVLAEETSAEVLADDFNEQAEIEEVINDEARAEVAAEAKEQENRAEAAIKSAPAAGEPAEATIGPAPSIESFMDAELWNSAPLTIPKKAAKTGGAPAKDRLSESKLAAKINGWINGQIVKFLQLKKTQQVILIIGVILLFFFAQSVVIIGRSYDKSGSWPTTGDDSTKEIENLLANAEAQNIFSDEAKALAALRQAQDLYSKLPKRAYNKAVRDSLWTKISATANLLEKIKTVDNPAVAADFGATNLIGLAKTGNIYWAFDNGSQSLIRLDPASGQKSFVTTTLANIAKLSAVDDKNLILLTTGGTYFKYDIAKNSSAAAKPSKDYFKIKAAAPASPMISPSLASSTINMSTVIENYSFYLDAGNSRLIVFDKDKVLKRQFVSPAFASSSAFAASYAGKKAWVYAQGKAYAIDLDF